MFHDLLAFLKECVPFSTTSTVVSNALFGHMLFLIVEGIRFNCGANLPFCGSRVGGRFSLFDVGFVACKSIMLVHLL